MVWAQGHEYVAWPQLGDTEVGTVHNAGGAFIAQCAEARDKVSPVRRKLVSSEVANVFEDYCLWPGCFDDVQRLWEEVPLVLMPELLASDGEGGTRNPCCNQINPYEARSVHVPEVGLNHLPVWAVVSERSARNGIDFHRTGCREAGLLDTECLASATRAKVQRAERHRFAPFIRANNSPTGTFSPRAILMRFSAATLRSPRSTPP